MSSSTALSSSEAAQRPAEHCWRDMHIKMRAERGTFWQHTRRCCFPLWHSMLAQTYFELARDKNKWWPPVHYQWLITNLSRHIDEFGEIQLASFLCLQIIQQTPCKREETAVSLLNMSVHLLSLVLLWTGNKSAHILEKIQGKAVGVPSSTFWQCSEEQPSSSLHTPLQSVGHSSLNASWSRGAQK